MRTSLTIAQGDIEIRCFNPDTAAPILWSDFAIHPFKRGE
jgi:hypothetical protein